MGVEINLTEYGPLGVLIGTWESSFGDDIAPSDDRGIENNKFREKLIFEPIGMVNNHEQTLFGLRYFKMAWRIGIADPFHEEVGYFLWDSKAKQVMRCFNVPRGISLIAGSTVEAKSTEFTLSAQRGSQTYGICSNQFLDVEFQTVRFDMKVRVYSPESFSYEEDTQILMKGRKDIFHHVDKNKLQKVK